MLKAHRVELLGDDRTWRRWVPCKNIYATGDVPWKEIAGL